MTNRLPGKPCVAANSRARRSALLGAAATALIATTPALHAATPEVQSAKLQQAVRNALRLPVGERMSVEAVRKAFGTPRRRSPPSAARSTSATATDHRRPRPDGDPAVECGREHLDRQYRRPDRRHRHRRLHGCGRPRHGPVQRHVDYFFDSAASSALRRCRQSRRRRLRLPSLHHDRRVDVNRST